MTTINTTSETTINATIAKGQIIRNGANNIFEITALNDNAIQMTTTNAIVEKTINMSRKVFVQLYARKNYVQVANMKTVLSEIVESRRTGASRFLVK
jgi:hypothetical protein